MRTLGIDLGSKRVGLAMSDEGATFATPFDVLEVSSPDEARARVVAIIEREGVERVVLGLPLNMDGSAGPAAVAVRTWGTELTNVARLPLVYVDERLSSFDAEQQLNERRRGGEKLTRGGKKKRLDAIAAASFLQAFLDGKIGAIG